MITCYISNKIFTHRTIYIVLVSAVMLIFQLPDGSLKADDHKREKTRDLRHEMKNECDGDSDHHRKHKGKRDHGNETTGQIALFLLVSANLPVVFSLVTKGVNRFIPLADQTKCTFQQMNQFQKKYLMRFHHILNLLAFCIAASHFLLSSCRRTALPEWGLLSLMLMVALGAMIKYKITPPAMRKIVYRLHTGPVMFAITIVLLLAGHMIVD